MLGLSLDRPVSIDAVLPGWICRHGRLRGISVRIVAANVKRIEVGVDVNTRRVLLVDPGRWAPGAQYRTLPGELRFPPMACDESD